MEVKVLRAVLFTGFGPHPLSGKCEYYVSGTQCGAPGIGVFQTDNQEAHTLCRDHAKEVFLQMIGASR